MEGWIKVHRGLLEWEWYDDLIVKSLFIHLILKANHKKASWHGMIIDKGQRFTSIKTLARELNLSEKQIKTALKKLQKTKEIETQGASNGTMITVCNYASYQGLEEDKGQAKRPTTDQQRDIKGTSKGDKQECKEEKKVKNVKNNTKSDSKESMSAKLDFELFWNLYDKKTGKEKCLSKWNKLSLATQTKILEYIPKYKVAQPDKKFRKNPETFFNNKSWEDELIQENGIINTQMQTKTRINYDSDKF